MTRRRIPDDEPPVEPGLPLHRKYRPTSFKEVRGQDAVLKSIKTALASATRPHAFLFSGITGTGKTTIARLAAVACGVSPENITEIDAASNSGIDAMRDVLAPLRYQGFGSSPNKMIIIDEAQGLSKQAFDSLLKTLEEPPQHVYFALCTTNPGKIPASINSRCAGYALRPLNRKELLELLYEVADAEGFKTSDAIIEAAAEAANGSPRQALVNLQKVHDIDGLDEALQLLEAVASDKEVIDVVRLLVNGKCSWKALREMLKAMPEPNAEGIRIVISCYIAGCIMSARSDGETEDLLDIAYEFRTPFNPSDKLMPLFLAFGALLAPRR